MLCYLRYHVFHMSNWRHESHFALNGYVSLLWPLTSLERLMIANNVLES